MEDLVFEVIKRNPECTVITGTFVPRRSSDGGENAYVIRSERYDDALKQWSHFHHHFVTDLFIDESDANGLAKLRRNLYFRDYVHLNGLGRNVYLELLGFVITSANFNDYSGCQEWPFKGKKRSATWKF